MNLFKQKLIKNKKIFIDFTGYIHKKKGGANSYVISLIKSLIIANNGSYLITIFIRKSQYQYFQIYKNFINIKTVNITNDFECIMWLNFCFPIISLKSNLVIFPLNIKPLFLFKKNILVIHDLNFLYYPDNFKSLKKRISVLFRIISIFTSTIRISISNQEKFSIYKNYKQKSIRIYHAIEKQSQNKFKNATSSFKTFSDYYLIISSLAVHKNIINCLKAINKLSERNLSSSFIFIGNWDIEDFPKVSSKNIIPLGYVSEEIKQQLISKCKAILIPSKYEGFGMPFIESIMNKKPLLACRIAVLEELLGDLPNYIEKPFSYKNIFNTLIDFEKSNKTKINLKNAYLKKFTHEKMGKNYFKVIRLIR